MIFNIIRTAKELFFNSAGTGLSATNAQDAITELRSLQQWKLLTSVSGSDVVSLKLDGYTELYASIMYNGIKFNELIPIVTLGDVERIFNIGGYYNSDTSNANVSAYFTKTTAKIGQVVINTSEVKSNCTMFIYAR